MSTPISAVVMTYNEEDHLPACLATLGWADEVLVFDSFSTDRTCELAQAQGARVVQHPFQNFAAQRNAAQAATTHDWVLFVDADERVSDELQAEIQALAQAGALAAHNAYRIRRVHLFSGRWFPALPLPPLSPDVRTHVQRSEMARLLDRRCAHWERAVHEELRVPEPVGVLAGVISHYSATTLAHAHATLNSYSDIEAAHLHRTRTHASVAEAVARGLRSFVFHYVVQRNYRYGEQGFLRAALLGYTKFLMYAKLAERVRIQQGRGIWTEADRRMLDDQTADKR